MKKRELCLCASLGTDRERKDVDGVCVVERAYVCRGENVLTL